MEQPKVIVIGGTSEGRMLASFLSFFAEVHMTVATEYGGQLAEDKNKESVIHIGRLDGNQMADLITQVHPIFLLDATHPYAKEVSKIARQACLRHAIPYYRVTRGRHIEENVCYVPDTVAAADYLSQTQGNILLTCGSKEIALFTSIDQFQERIFARILPQEDVLRSCIEMGFKPSQLTLMQGPFSLEFNKAHLQMIGAKYLVTKDSGTAGGLMQKIQAAKELGVQVLVIDREEEEGYTKEEFMEEMAKEYGWSMTKDLKSTETSDIQPEYFPLFHNLKNKKIIIFGGGKIAKRRIKGLKDFGSLLTVVSLECDEEILEMERLKELSILHRGYMASDCHGADYVLACTNNHRINEEISMECREANIPVNVAHSKELSDFYFPGIVTKGNLVVGITAGGRNHKLAKQATARVRSALEDIHEGERND